jgi:hypothetical protein
MKTILKIWKIWKKTFIEDKLTDKHALLTLLLTQPEQASTAVPELGTAQPQLVFFFVFLLLLFSPFFLEGKGAYASKFNECALELASTQYFF